jgi:large subunit ribosomal protein L10
MKKVGLIVREKIVDDIKDGAKDASACFFVKLNRIPAFSLNTMRNGLQRQGAKLFMAKNTLIKKAFKDVGYDDLEGLLGNETGVVFVHDQDAVKACKTLVDFIKENENIVELRGGFLSSKKISSKDMSDLAKLPSREVMLGIALGTMVAPLTGFLSAMNQVILKFVWTVEEIKKKKS